MGQVVITSAPGVLAHYSPDPRQTWGDMPDDPGWPHHRDSKEGVNP